MLGTVALYLLYYLVLLIMSLGLFTYMLKQFDMPESCPSIIVKMLFDLEHHLSIDHYLHTVIRFNRLLREYKFLQIQ